MNLTFICVFYPPINSSAAVQVNHLVEELARQGHYVEVITPDSTIKKPYSFERKKNIKIMRFNHGRCKKVSLPVGECCMRWLEQARQTWRQLH